MTTMMVEDIRLPTAKSRLQSRLIIATVALVFGATCGLIYGHQTSTSLQQSQSGIPLTEITVSREGLLFKSEDGTPLLKIRKDFWGTHFDLLGSNGKPVVELNNLQGTGRIAVGSKAGSFAYMQAHEDSATISVMSKYNKQAVEITSTTPDGSGSLSINEGAQGYPAIEIGAGANKMNSKGIITILGNNGRVWQAP